MNIITHAINVPKGICIDSYVNKASNIIFILSGSGFSFSQNPTQFFSTCSNKFTFT